VIAVEEFHDPGFDEAACRAASRRCELAPPGGGDDAGRLIG
jgi:hypothetical protein